VVVVVDWPASGNWCRLVSYYRKGKERKMDEKLENEIKVARFWATYHALMCEECRTAKCPVGTVIGGAVAGLIDLRIVTDE
jgi:hypothetical protein